MRNAFREAASLLLAVSLGVGPLPAPARADEASAARIKRILTADEKKEVSLPTDRVQRVTVDGDTKRIEKKDEDVSPGEAVLTRSASTVVQVEKGREAYLYAETFVRFDEKTVWLLRNGAVFVVNTKGRLEIVAEALGRILVSSKVLLRSDGAELFAFVTEGRVVLEAGARTLSLGPGQAGRVTMGGAPEKVSLGAEEQAELSKGLEATEKVMKGGGGSGGLIAGLVAAGVIVGAATILSGHDKDDRGGSGSTGGGGGGSQGEPDLTPVAGKTCRFDDGRLVISVGNRGQARALDSTAEVILEFARTTARRTGTMDGPAAAQRQQLRIGKLEPGEKTDVTVETGGAWISAYRLTVDRDGSVRESNERNNTATIRCPPPVD